MSSVCSTAVNQDAVELVDVISLGNGGRLGRLVIRSEREGRKEGGCQEKSLREQKDKEKEKQTRGLSLKTKKTTKKTTKKRMTTTTKRMMMNQGLKRDWERHRCQREI